MLDGKIVNELNQSGQKQKGYVFAGGQLFAEQENNWVRWRHEAPLTGSSGASFSDGSYAREVETDSTGVNVGLFDPFLSCCQIPPETFIPTLMGDSEACNGNPNCLDCSLDGMPMPNCELPFILMARGAGLIDANNPSPSVLISLGSQPIYGRYCVTVSSHGTVETECFILLDGYTSPTTVSTAMNLQPLQPQNTGQPPIHESGVRQNIANRLTDPCKQYIANLINEAARQNRKNPAVSTNLLDIFAAVQKQGGFHRLQVGTRKNPSYSHVRGTIPRKSATVYLAPLKLYPDMTAAEIAQGALSLDSLGAFHELTHLAGKNEYDDIQLSRAARALGGPALPTAKTNKDLAFSTYLEAELKGIVHLR